MEKPLGLVDVDIEGHRVKLVVLNSLCCNVIVWKDLMRSEKADKP